MSAPLFMQDVLFFQRLLSAEGLYTDTLDGDWGPHTEAAAVAFDQRAEAIRQQLGSFDTRSERHIATLCLKAQQLARQFLRQVLGRGLNVRIISGTRTYAEQNALYRQGRFGNPGPVVTNARAGFSNHNFGVAWDIGVFTADGGYVDDGPPYIDAAEGVSPQLEWGGNWTSFVDKPHYQLKLGVPVSELRTAFESGHAQALFH